MPVNETSSLSPPTDRRRIRLAIVVVAWGIQAIVTQSILLREALVLMFGSEFAWGVVLFAWLFGVAVGAAVGGWWAERVGRADVGLVSVLLGLSIAACVELWIFRGARAWLGVEPGEFLPLGKTAIAAMLFVSPTGALVGMAFPFACCIRGGAGPSPSRAADFSPRGTPDCTDGGSTSESSRGLKSAARVYPNGVKSADREVLQLGNVYALESAGSLIGGAVFSFWAVEHLAPIQTALGCGAITALALAGFVGFARRKRYGAVSLIVLAVTAATTSVVAGSSLDHRLRLRRWHNIAPGYELCAEVESKYQNLAVGRRAEQFTLYSDGQVAADFPDPYTFVPLAHFWLCEHPSPRNVLVLGGGAEGLLSEILRHPVEHVDYVEPDPRQIALIEPYLADADRQALNDSRVTVHNVDARYFVKTQRDRFDLVIARLPEPMSALRARLYTEEFYGELRRAMTPRSVLCMTATATPGQLSAPSAEYLASIRATLRTSFPYVTVGWGNPAHLLAATDEGLVSTNATELAGRYLRRSVQSDRFHPAWFDGAVDWLDEDKLQQRQAELDAVTGAKITTDLRPVVYVQRLALWERMTGGRSGGVIAYLQRVGWTEVLAALAGVSAMVLLAGYLRARTQHELSFSETVPSVRLHWLSGSAVTLSVGTTGFVTMALSIICLFAFQNLYGYVYQRIGWIIAIFMGGLVIGCGVAGWGTRRFTDDEARVTRMWRWLIAVDVLLAALALVVPFVLPALGTMRGGPSSFAVVEWCVSIMVALTGALGGAAFAVAGGLQMAMTARPGATAGTVVGADHAGACLGALVCGILLVPVFGTAAAALLLAAIKLASTAFLVVGAARAKHAQPISPGAGGV